MGLASDNPDQIIGLMAPQSGSTQYIGDSYVSAVDAAFKEYKVQSQSAIVGYKAPLVVVCDETADPAAAASHLLDTVGVKVIIGPAWGNAIQTVLPRALEVGAILMMPLNDDPALADTPNTKGQIWSVRPSRKDVVTYWKSAFGEFEKTVKKKTDAPTTLKVTMAVAGDNSSQTLANRAVGSTDFNGKTYQQNVDAGNFARLNYGDYRDINQNVVYSTIAANLIASSPNVIVIVSSGDGAANLVPAIEKAWPTEGTPPPRPYYLIVGATEGIEPAIAIQSGGTTLPSRILGLGDARDSTTLNNLKDFRSAYKSASSTGDTPRADAEFYYDAFWLTEYALYAATSKGKVPVTSLDGATFSSKGIDLLNPQGTAVNVGALGSPEVFSLLSNNGNPDLNGSSSRLDFDLAAGSPKASGALYCVNESLKLIPSGVEFSAV
ncbi:MAG: hypothetical protein EOO74_08385, partial [Myxococcales bacterium]